MELCNIIAVFLTFLLSFCSSDMKGIPMSSLVIYKANDQFQPQVFTKVIDKTEDELVTWARQKTIPVFVS